jgi:hypothetical protein
MPNQPRTDNPARSVPAFEEVVAEWMRSKRYDVESVESVEGLGSDMDGDTMHGFYASFGTYIKWRAPGGATQSLKVDGDDMVSLWKHVVGAWSDHA